MSILTNGAFARGHIQQNRSIKVLAKADDILAEFIMYAVILQRVDYYILHDKSFVMKNSIVFCMKFSGF